MTNTWRGRLPLLAAAWDRRLAAVGKGVAGTGRREDKPIFLSIGYAACHWCHVMAHESFEDEATAAALNRDFVAVKVDREERPDVDTIYMEAVVLGQGGWLSFDAGEPFYGGTYSRRPAMAAGLSVLQAVAAPGTATIHPPTRPDSFGKPSPPTPSSIRRPDSRWSVRRIEFGGGAPQFPATGSPAGIREA
jgi:hypothetical protein